VVLAIRSAGLDQGSQGSPHRPQAPHLLLDVGDFRFRGRTHLPARDAPILSESEQLLDLGQAEAEFLRPLDEPDPADGFGSVLAIAGSAPRRFWEQASSLVEAKGLDVYAGPASHFSDAERFHGTVLHTQGSAPYTVVQGQAPPCGNVSPRIGELVFHRDVSAVDETTLPRWMERAGDYILCGGRLGHRERRLRTLNFPNGGEPVSHRRALDFIQSRYMLSLTEAPFDVTDATLHPEAGACSTCPLTCWSIALPGDAQADGGLQRAAEALQNAFTADAAKNSSETIEKATTVRPFAIFVGC
jgi:hypothetical protein